MTRRSPDESSLGQLSSLTPAEQNVLDEALTGATAREIGERLSLTEATVRSHLSRIYLKLGVSGRVALLASFRETDAEAEPTPVQPASRSPRRSQATRAAVIGLAAVAIFVASVATIRAVVERDPADTPSVSYELAVPVVADRFLASHEYEVQAFRLEQVAATGSAGERVLVPVALALLPYTIVLLGLGYALARVTAPAGLRR